MSQTKFLMNANWRGEHISALVSINHWLTEAGQNQV